MEDNSKDMIYLDKNESAFDLPEHFAEEVAEIARKLDLRQYPEDFLQSFRETIGKYHGLGMENVVTGNGSDQVISFILDYWRDRNFVLSTPTFGMYKFVMDNRGYKYTEVPLTENFQPDIERIMEISNAAYIICSPNNPTGNDIDRSIVLRLLDTGYPVIVDEAYAHFTDHNFTDLLDRYSNLVILRTFSKAFGLAGLRVGYSLSSPEIAKGILQMVPAFAMGTFQIAVATKMLEYTDYVKRNADLVRKERDRILERLGEYAYPSSTNFYVVKLDMFNFLKENGVQARQFGGILADKVRITVGTREENDRVLELVQKFLDNI